MSNEGYSLNQIITYRDMRDILIEAQRRIVENVDQSPEIMRKAAKSILEVLIPKYEEFVPEGVREKFGFNVEGLAELARGLLEDDVP
ncbi:hypothetical protein GOV12_01870 [Candidatus Pacearchaeota archaeon]|nr:hypothetical protein [Candidatus Pacearchaeota archaeon]